MTLTPSMNPLAPGYDGRAPLPTTWEQDPAVARARTGQDAYDTAVVRIGRTALTDEVRQEELAAAYAAAAEVVVTAWLDFRDRRVARIEALRTALAIGLPPAGTDRLPLDARHAVVSAFEQATATARGLDERGLLAALERSIRVGDQVGEAALVGVADEHGWDAIVDSWAVSRGGDTSAFLTELRSLLAEATSQFELMKMGNLFRAPSAIGSPLRHIPPAVLQRVGLLPGLGSSGARTMVDSQMFTGRSLG